MLTPPNQLAKVKGKLKILSKIILNTKIIKLQKSTNLLIIFFNRLRVEGPGGI